MHQLTGTDATMLVTDRPHSRNLIGAVAIYDPSTAPGGVRFKDVLARLERRSHLSTLFTHKLVQVPLGLDWRPSRGPASTTSGSRWSAARCATTSGSAVSCRASRWSRLPRHDASAS